MTTAVSCLPQSPSLCQNLTLLSAYPCAGVATDFSITVDQLITWNPWVGSNCDLGLYAGLGPNDQNAVCVGVNSTEPTASATSGPSTTTSAGATAAPTQTGIVSTCTTYYTARSGDTCSGIAAMYTITFDQFYAWNPAGKLGPALILVGNPDPLNQNFNFLYSKSSRFHLRIPLGGLWLLRFSTLHHIHNRCHRRHDVRSSRPHTKRHPGRLHHVLHRPERRFVPEDSVRVQYHIQSAVHVESEHR